MTFIPKSGAYQRFVDALERFDCRRGQRFLCPAHDDKNPSLSVSQGADGRVLVKCHAGCETETIVEALELAMGDLFESDRQISTGGRDPRNSNIPPKPRATVQLSSSGLTLAQYASTKKLPLDLLQALSITDTVYRKRPAIRIPYLDEEGTELAVRYRLSVGNHGSGTAFRWEKGATVAPYGLWLLDDARSSGYVVICEGESDAHTLWLHAVPAIGIPGANSWRDSWVSHLEGISTIYVVVEPDEGGEAVQAWLGKSSIRDRCRILRLSDAKDPSDLHCAGPENFSTVWQEAMQNAEPWKDNCSEGTTPDRDSLFRQCHDIAESADILDRFARDVARKGLAGERKAAQLLYLVVTSRLLSKPVSASIKGTSSVGKSFLVERVLEFFPPNAYFALSAMSEKALAYSREPLSHRFLVLYESAGLISDTATYLLRSLLSEGHIRYETVERTKKGLEPKLIERPGPTGLIVTTTDIQLHPENETRVLSIPVSDTPEQTREVLKAIAEENRPEVDLAQWVAVQDWLASGERKVTIPFATELAENIPPVAVRLRRDFSVVLNLIRAHALLHQATRSRNSEGGVVATLDDYSRVRELVSDVLAEGVGASVPETVRETVNTVSELSDEYPGGLTNNRLAQRLKLDKSTVSRRVRQAIKLGYLINEETQRGKPARLVLGDPLPEAATFLPSAEELGRCTVARESKGDSDESPLADTA